MAVKCFRSLLTHDPFRNAVRIKVSVMINETMLCSISDFCDERVITL